uniref:Uncharacterized protein n=1 Tax=Melanthalia intermedia TaxID=172989 RepID=A0A345UB18_9FLOR|nr:hypothetical protein [Melanthalia intermedia]AXI97654.1 hypothetical protein [Melanthalia intermedia]
MINSLLNTRLNNQLNIIKTQTSPYIRIKLAYSEQYSDQRYHLDLFFKIQGGAYSRNVRLGDLIQDICDYVISPFLSIQTSRMIWNFISLMYPKSKANKNILNIPIRGMQGQVLTEDSDGMSTNVGVLNFCARYQGYAMSSATKLIGVADYYLNPQSYNSESCLEVIDQCEKVFYQSIQLKRTQLTIEFVQEKKVHKKPGAKSNKSSRSSKEKLATVYRKPILVTALP